MAHRECNCNIAIGEYMSNFNFDTEGFYAALDSARQAKGITWKSVASGSGVAASTLTRMGQGKRPDVDGLAALAAWSGIDASAFYRGDSVVATTAEPLAQITALLRADKNLEPESAKAIESMIKSAYEHMRVKRGKT
jgi:transcriptional regulator with XRE-family HTH domain